MDKVPVFETGYPGSTPGRGACAIPGVCKGDSMTQTLRCATSNAMFARREFWGSRILAITVACHVTEGGSIPLYPFRCEHSEDDDG